MNKKSENKMYYTVEDLKIDADKSRSSIDANIETIIDMMSGDNADLKNKILSIIDEKGIEKEKKRMENNKVRNSEKGYSREGYSEEYKKQNHIKDYTPPHYYEFDCSYYPLLMLYVKYYEKNPFIRGENSKPALDIKNYIDKIFIEIENLPPHLRFEIRDGNRIQYYGNKNLKDNIEKFI